MFRMKMLDSEGMMKYRAKRSRRGRYEYRGFVIYTVGYYPPERRVCWEVLDKDGSAFGHSFSLKGAKYMVDESLDKDELKRYRNRLIGVEVIG